MGFNSFMHASRGFLPILAAYACLSCFWVATGGETPADASLPPDIGRIVKRGRLVVAIRVNSGIPISFLSPNGALKGIECDLARKMSEALDVGLELRTEPKTPEDALNMVRKGEADMALANLTVNPRRAMSVIFGDPYLSLNSTLLVSTRLVSRNPGQNSGLSIVDLVNRPQVRVGVLKSSSNEELARTLLSNARIRPLPSYEAIFAELKEKRLDAMLSDDLRCVGELRRNPELTINFAAYILTDRQDNIAPIFNWHDTHLREWYNVWLSGQSGGKYRLADLLRDYPEAFTPESLESRPAAKAPE